MLLEFDDADNDAVAVVETVAAATVDVEAAAAGQDAVAAHSAAAVDAVAVDRCRQLFDRTVKNAISTNAVLSQTAMVQTR